MGAGRRRVHRRRAARVAVARPRARARPPALAALAAEVEDSGGVRVLPALAGLGAPWWKAGGAGGRRRGYRRNASGARRARDTGGDRLAGRRHPRGHRESTPVDVLRVDGGLTRELTAAAASGRLRRHSGRARRRGRHGNGAAALAAVGAGLWPATAAIAERIPTGERFEPRRDDAWRTVGARRVAAVRGARGGTLKAASVRRRARGRRCRQRSRACRSPRPRR